MISCWSMSIHRQIGCDIHMYVTYLFISHFKSFIPICVIAGKGESVKNQNCPMKNPLILCNKWDLSFSIFEITQCDYHQCRITPQRNACLIYANLRPHFFNLLDYVTRRSEKLGFQKKKKRIWKYSGQKYFSSCDVIQQIKKRLAKEIITKLYFSKHANITSFVILHITSGGYAMWLHVFHLAILFSDADMKKKITGVT